MSTPPAKPPLTVDILQSEAATFSAIESIYPEPSLYGVTDGKAVGTYLEHKFRAYLETRYSFAPCNSASGVDFPELQVDMKVTSIWQPQSSCPFWSARQKIFGLGYALLVFVYDKTDDSKTTTSTLNILHTVFVEPHRTGDFQMTRLIRQMLENEAIAEDLVALMTDRNLPLDDVEASSIADELLQKPPEQGYLPIFNALRLQLQYKRVITQAGNVEGIHELRVDIP